jgi:hypothetical protein
MKIEKPVYSVDLGTPHTVSTSMFVLSGAASVPPTPSSGGSRCLTTCC